MHSYPTGDLYILHHLELGDCFICKGAVVTYADQYNVKLFVKRANEVTIRQLYRDTAIELISVRTFDEAYVYLLDHALLDRTLIMGGRTMDWSIPFDRAFYDMAGLPLTSKWDRFSLQRDNAAEENVYASAVSRTPYVFTHLNNLRGHGNHLDISQFNPMPIIEPTAKLDGPGGVLSWLKVIEGANTVVVSNSCFLNLIDISGIKGPRLIYCKSTHNNRHDREQPQLRLNWELV